jgi:hypothetical protein
MAQESVGFVRKPLRAREQSSFLNHAEALEAVVLPPR